MKKILTILLILGRRGEPGYRDKLDRDGDGIACETR